MKLESELAAHVIEWLTSDRWECYCEVPLSSGRADIVAVRGSVVWIVETKLRLNMELMNQCRDRLRAPCNGVLAVYGRRAKGQEFAFQTLATHWGFGMAYCFGPRMVVMDHVPPLRRVKTAKTLALLRPEMKTNVAGTNGAYWTPFKKLVEELRIDLREAPLRELTGLECMKRYKMRAPAANRRALTDYLGRGLVPGWGLEKRDGLLWAVKEPTPA